MLLSDLVNQTVNTMRILIVDDEALARQIVTRMFKACDWTVREASSGEEALRAWQPGRFDAVLTDFSMPGMNGVALAEQIRAGEACQPTARPARLILISGSIHETETGSTIAEGLFDAVLAKPVSFDVIRRAASGKR